MKQKDSAIIKLLNALNQEELEKLYFELTNTTKP